MAFPPFMGSESPEEESAEKQPPRRHKGFPAKKKGKAAHAVDGLKKVNVTYHKTTNHPKDGKTDKKISVQGADSVAQAGAAVDKINK